MKRLIAIILALFVAATPSSGAEPDEKKTIPLDKIWAYKMPGTITLSDAVRAGEVKPEGELVLAIRRALQSHVEKTPQKGFAVAAPSVIDALRKMSTILATDEDPQERFQTTDEIYAVFFSYEAGAYCHIRSAQLDGKTLTIRYSYVPHDSQETTEHFALIPLGRLVEGPYSVVIEQKRNAKIEQPTRRSNESNPFVCRPYKFVVEAAPSP